MKAPFCKNRNELFRFFTTRRATTEAAAAVPSEHVRPRSFCNKKTADREPLEVREHKQRRDSKWGG